MTPAMWDARYAASLVWDLEPSPFVVAALAKVRKGRALDLGAGDGRHAFWLASKGWKVTAVDSSAVAVGTIQARAAILGLDVTAVVADVTAYQATPQAWDLVLLSYLQLPLEQLDRVVRHAALALAEGGRLLIVAHDSSNLTDGTGGPSDPGVLAPVQRVAELVSSRGLIVLRSEVVTRKVPVEVGFRTAYDHVVEAIRFDVPHPNPA